MSRRLVPCLFAAVLIGATLLPMQALGESQPTAVPVAGGALVADANEQNGPDTDDRVCTTGGAMQAHCHARVRTDHKLLGRLPMRVGLASSSRFSGGGPLPAFAALGNGGAYDPGYLRSAYNLTNASNTAGHGRTVAIVDAYDAPNAEADVNYYRSWFGLSACTTASGCFRKVNQTGASGPYPAVDASWAQEVSLDLDMVSAICPNCNILLVEASSNGFADLGVAVNTAAALGATVISNSYGAGEWNGEAGYWETFYNHPGIPVTVSAGDAGYGVEFPAASSYTVAVGGTSLNQPTNTGTRNATETVWSGSGSGCSAFIPKPSWQRDGGCSNRTVADVAAVADPSTGVWVYDSTPAAGRSGWLVLGGTSVAAPIVGSVFALAASGPVQYASGMYLAGASLFDITSGSNGGCGGLYLCTGAPGFDGPTGNGSPNGDSAFAGGVVLTPTNTPTATLSPTSTSTPTHTPTPASTPTNSPTPAPTSTASATSTSAATSTPTNTRVPTNTPAPTSTRTSTSTVTPTRTPTATSTRTATPTATQAPQTSYSTGATTLPTSLARGATIAVSASVTSTTASTALVDLEIYDQAGHKVYQRWWDNQVFNAGQPRAYNVSWLIPTTDMAGTYTVKMGIFKPGWAALYSWNNGAALFTVT